MKMNNVLLEPSSVFDFFAQINRIPRPSKNEKRMIEFLERFALERSLLFKKDGAGNVLICKPASKGMEDRRTVVLQSHMDMVCEKNKDVDFDFLTDAIQTRIDGEWMRACGTTLGADDGIGMAMQLALLDSSDILHPALECLFTTDEETGLTGAFAIEQGFMSGDILINLDSEDEGEIFVSCAGGATTTAVFDVSYVSLPVGMFVFELRINGLTGGHSGDDIDKNRANANKLLVRFLYDCLQRYDLYLIDIQSGGLHNAIPRESCAVCAVPVKDKERFVADWNIFAAQVGEEYCVTEPNVRFDVESSSLVDVAIDPAVTRRLLCALQAVDNGVYAMSQNMNLVQTSSNLASVKRTDSRCITVVTSQRSSIDSARRNMSATVRAAFELAGADVRTSEGYPGWKMNPDSLILGIAVQTYEELFGKKPIVRGIHAGLECGLFSEKYPGLDMISVGPTLRGVHSPDERLCIPTVAMVWKHLLAMLQRIPVSGD